MDLLINALNKSKILKLKNSTELLKALCCDPKNPDCLERTCAACAGRVPEYTEFSNDVLVTYYEWKRVVKEITTGKGNVKKQQMTSKEKETGEPLKLIPKKQVVKAVEEADVVEREKKIPKDLKTFKGTLSVHQVIWDKYHKWTTMRSISCFLCDAGEICHHGKHLGFIDSKTTVPDSTHLDDYDVVIP
ncbi:hypothetical protein ACJJTC_014453 [Scirpophaga incertulas]